MVKQVSNKNQIQQYKKRQNNLNKLLYNQPSRLLISPMQVLVISLIFIANVFLLHILAKLVPGSSLPQAAIALMVVLLSIAFSFLSSK
ncbi:hypothetical protein EHEL_090920 [Encephalitozoon hellem ATCC 50504]|uniref:Sec61beta n=1 Tax=Encephalitozoon hellem TaxID=27973 RepID=A0A9Q9F8Y4_ENCHE|nr:uncharacterized protein EHEL_090920 [Encephalitozoon hellem ATCC 50504]AFM98987.1 hypothetical protein EHEL_090920 [Encephalitozoon hellem ATCC 50504]UTX44003.1 hypothetical protein GPU96_09g17830 [Encephalitozoon hellem]WEL39488.1 hypothetical protein PFJ87_09g01160 [Encephalitozoon hellem]|eukprot:XP_003887968.1 hypothetical protein EHEL_090920 [Encephalitozoon hellem ATCC 50504]